MVTADDKNHRMRTPCSWLGCRQYKSWLVAGWWEKSFLENLGYFLASSEWFNKPRSHCAMMPKGARAVLMKYQRAQSSESERSTQHKTIRSNAINYFKDWINHRDRSLKINPNEIFDTKNPMKKLIFPQVRVRSIRERTKPNEPDLIRSEEPSNQIRWSSKFHKGNSVQRKRWIERDINWNGLSSS